MFTFPLCVCCSAITCGSQYVLFEFIKRPTVQSGLPEIMSLGSLLAVAGIAVAAYSIARPVQRKSLCMFVPVGRLILLGLVLPAAALMVEFALQAWGFGIGRIGHFLVGAGAFLAPVVALAWAAITWHRARLVPQHESGFKLLVRASLNEASYDEIERVLMLNTDRLHKIATEEMVAMLYDRHVIAALARHHSWIHLQLLAEQEFFDRVKKRAGFSHCPREVELVIREYLVAEESPLRLFVVSRDEGDPTALATAEERNLIESTFENHRWYSMAKVEQPVFAVCRELLDSRALDESYNRRDDYYTCSIGLSSRSRCPLYLAEKVMYHGFQQALEPDAPAGTARSEMWWLFMEVHKHSRYNPKEWDDPTSEYPTPFAYLMYELCSDLWGLLYEAHREAMENDGVPSGLVQQLAEVWAQCVATLGQDMVEERDCVSRRFAEERAEWYLKSLLEWECWAHDEEGNEIATRLQWSRMLLNQLKDKLHFSKENAGWFIGRLSELDLYGRTEDEYTLWLESELNSLIEEG